MPNTYVTGYNGTVRTLESLLGWSGFTNLDPEFRRRALALMDASIVAGRPLGLGGTYRSSDGQLSLFLSRHHEVSVGGCCKYNGKRYALNSGSAHAAAPGRSYHEGTTPDNKGLAIDWIGDLAFLRENCAAYGLNEASTWSTKEPWHGQPSELPRSRSGYLPGTMHPLKPWVIPGAPAPAPTKIWAPKPVLKIRTGLLSGKNDVAQVRALQMACNFWGWRDAQNKTLSVDGDFGEKTAQAVISMQRDLHKIAAQFGKSIVVDGIYGAQTATAFQAFLDAMAAWV